MPQPWTEDEVRVAVDDYMHMLELELRGDPYVKADYIRRACQRLPGRTDKAVEFKWANISAVLEGLQWPFIDGYLPRWNYQQLLADEVIRRVDGIQPAVVEQSCAPPSGGVPTSLIKLVTPRRLQVDPTAWARPAWAPGRSPVRIDFLEAEQRNRALGRAGEAAVLEWERHRLHVASRSDLAARVEWVSQSRGDGLGYDIESFNDDGSSRWIEVKTTNRGQYMPFMASRTEVECSEAEPQRYQLYRLFDFRREPQLFILGGSLRTTCALDPRSYLARAV